MPKEGSPAATSCLERELSFHELCLRMVSTLACRDTFSLSLSKLTKKEVDLGTSHGHE